MMSQYEVYVFEADKMIQGFVGLNDKYIEGIFVSDEMQSCGIGKLLLDYIKDKKVSLLLIDNSSIIISIREIHVLREDLNIDNPHF